MEEIVKAMKIESEFLSYYKNFNKLEEYRKRQKECLEKYRKDKRQEKLDKNRGISTASVKSDINLTNNDLSENNSLNVLKDVDMTKMENRFYLKHYESKSKFANIMMLAEWFLGIPDHFYDEYFLKLCPFGKHVLLIIKDGKTYLVNKYGTIIKSFTSSFTGGGWNDNDNRKHLSIFDCIYNKDKNIIYLLDIIYYLQNGFQDITAQSRNEWLEHFAKTELITEIKCDIQMSFELIEYVSCKDENLEQFFKLKPFTKIDGILSYWIYGHYEAGSTSFCATWFKPYMIPELFGFKDVHPDYLENIPMDYGDYRQFIENYNEKYRVKDQPKSTKWQKKKVKQTKGDAFMEIEEKEDKMDDCNNDE